MDPLNNLHKLADLRVIEANSDAWKGEANYLLPRSDGDTVAIPIKNFEFLKVEKAFDIAKYLDDSGSDVVISLVSPYIQLRQKFKSTNTEPLQWVQAKVSSRKNPPFC